MLFDDIPARPTFTLYNLSLSLQSCVKTNFPGAVWVVAEISNLGVHRASGHCYLELVDFDPATRQQRASMRATIWARNFARVQRSFRLAAGVDLQAGVTVRVLGTLEYSPVYGFSLNISDIDGTYTAGALALKRQQTLAQLARDGVMGLNRALPRPAFPRRVAVVSSPTAAGYEDFMQQIAGAKARYALTIQLFEAVMQGERAPGSIVDALGRIAETRWDVVVLIRGGGGKLDLSCFDDYTLASHVAQFPLPIYAGIGHERDQSVVDLVANATLKTPTATAEFVQSFFSAREQDFLATVQFLAQGARAGVDANRVMLDHFSGRILEMVRSRVLMRMADFTSILRQFALGFGGKARLQAEGLDSVCQALARDARGAAEREWARGQTAAQGLAVGAMRQLAARREELGAMRARLASHRPAAVLARGYVRVERADGTAIARAACAREGESVRLRWADGVREGSVGKDALM